MTPIAVNGFFLLITMSEVIFFPFITERAFAASSFLSIVIGFVVMIFFTGKNLKIPNTFDIKYMYVGRENQYLNKISTCVLESMNVTYGGDRYKTFDGNEDGAPPVETTITLNFKEMELITKQRAEEGF